MKQISMVGWTDDEKTGFVEWDRARKAGELGESMKFVGVPELRKWLDEYKNSDKSERTTMGVEDFVALLKSKV